MSGHARVLLLGATGFTGRLTAIELRRLAVPFTPAGRSAARLEALCRELGSGDGGGVPFMVARPDDPGSLRAAMEGHGAVIATVGPFTDLGEPAVKAAVETGVPYLDTTGEQGFMRAMWERYDEAARQRGIAIVCAHAFEYALGECAAALAVEAAGGSADVLDVVYSVSGGGTSPGTRRSIVRALSDPMVSWVDRRLVRERPAAVSIEVTLPGEERPRTAISFPGGEPLHAGRHLDVGTCRSFMVLPRRLARRFRLAAPILPALRFGPLRALADLVAGRGEGPAEEQRTSVRFKVAARATGGGRTTWCLVEGTDGYALTAALAARGAVSLAEGRARSTGVVSTAMAFDPREVLAPLRESYGLSVSVVA